MKNQVDKATVLERSQAPPGEMLRSVFGDIPIVITYHAVEEFTKDIKTLPKEPERVLEGLLRAAKQIPSLPRERERSIEHWRNGCFWFVVLRQCDPKGKEIQVIIVTCWKNQWPRRPRTRETRAAQKREAQKIVEEDLEG